MHDDAVLLVLELIVPEDDAPHPAKLVDLQMLFLLGGRERTRSEWAELLRRGVRARRRPRGTAGEGHRGPPGGIARGCGVRPHIGPRSTFVTRT
jgi:hypothetical protein